jgi:lipopolysaccharide export system protein LptA
MMDMRKTGIILAVTALAGTAAWAQTKQVQPVSALKGHNSNAPVDVTAERIEVQDRADRAIFAGNVHVTQAELTLDTPRLTVAYSGGQGGNNNVQIRRLDAAGGVVVKSPSETAKGDFGIYDLDRKLITLIGNVQLNREQNQVNGARLVIDLDSGRAVVDGGPPGVNSSGLPAISQSRSASRKSERNRHDPPTGRGFAAGRRRP